MIKKEKLSSLKEKVKTIRKKTSILIGKQSSIKWQATAFRYADYLKIKLTDTMKTRWLKFFKQNHTKSRVQTTVAYLADYSPFIALETDEAKVKYFFWYFYKKNQ